MITISHENGKYKIKLSYLGKSGMTFYAHRYDQVEAALAHYEQQPHKAISPLCTEVCNDSQKPDDDKMDVLEGIDFPEISVTDEQVNDLTNRLAS